MPQWIAHFHAVSNLRLNNARMVIHEEHFDLDTYKVVMHGWSYKYSSKRPVNI